MAKPNIKQFTQNLHNGIIVFAFKKKSDGTSRKARGTLDKRLMPNSFKAWRRKTNRRAPKNSVVFFDLDKQEIRSFKDYLLQKIEKYGTYDEVMQHEQKVRQQTKQQPNEKHDDETKQQEDQDKKS